MKCFRGDVTLLDIRLLSLVLEELGDFLLVRCVELRRVETGGVHLRWQEDICLGGNGMIWMSLNRKVWGCRRERTGDVRIAITSSSFFFFFVFFLGSKSFR